MLKYHIAIVEDEPRHINHLKTHLETYQNENEVLFETDVFNDGHEIVDNYKGSYDLIFLDIELIQLNGMETAELIREFDEDVTIIFVTNLANFAIRGYEVDAHSFLIKPVQYFRFSRELKKALTKINKSPQQFIAVNTEDGMRKVMLSDIDYIESMKHELIIHTSEITYSLWGTLKEMEAKLAPYNFYRSNYCYLVNLAHVKGVDGDFVIVDDHKLKISRSRKKEFMEALTDFFRGGL